MRFLFLPRDLLVSGGSTSEFSTTCGTDQPSSGTEMRFMLSWDLQEVVLPTRTSPFVQINKAVNCIAFNKQLAISYRLVSLTSLTVVTNGSSFDPHLDPYPLEEISLPTVMSKARFYTDVNVICPKDYWDYESLNVEWGIQAFFFVFAFFREQDDYESQESDTSALEARNGKDIQGIPWEKLNYSRDQYRH
ncbi:hypothetical protein DY000_02047072 [Brassica cretica]|uniref:Uncharacterized protein n=1 Tax=Brassica cretica TaxID=69181 RepID=A0ABQ7FAQ9_BRACR|nr:hypothetical protein DY000_02047072 [Brassica cretica]